MPSDWADQGWTATVNMRAEQLFFNFSFSSMRGRWLQPVQTTHYTCGIYGRDGQLSCIHSNLTERGTQRFNLSDRHLFAHRNIH
ncbi:hypothetical protein ILYODFUR_023528 [Ilyodon furcidens]|uniref:Uncharacterized protein n=1 Tax=Ilyodon furcidens TaxID=33524 RepID=A0ABV0T0W5_9TELE